MKVYGLIGYPLSHSFSVSYFDEKFKMENVADTKYLNFPIESIDHFPELLDANPDLLGLNVTIPYKEKIMAYLDSIVDEARTIGAVNTIKIENIDGKRILTGYNTDAVGFLTAIKPFLTDKISSALILGTGGASKAIRYALNSRGIKTLMISRNAENADFSYQNITENIIRENLLIVNCSPVGTFPKIEECPEIPYKALSNEHLLFDLVYNPEETLFMKKGKEKGASVLNGYQMLVGQAEESWKIWNL